MKDRFGLSLTTNSYSATENYSKGIDICLAANANAEKYLQNSIKDDPEFSLPYAALALLHDMWGRQSEKDLCLQKAIKLSEKVSKREKNHVFIIAKILENNKIVAFNLLKQHISEFPQDAFIISQITGAYSVLSFSGNKNFELERLNILENIEKYYDSDWWFDGMYSYSLTEVNRHNEACKLAEKSLQKMYHNGHTSHTYSHILYETKQNLEGDKFLLEWFKDYDENAPIAGHIRWHQALFQSLLGNPSQALNIYLTKIKPSICTSPNYGKVIDAASLLWRLKLKNNKIDQSLWQEINEFNSLNFNQIGDPFLDIHKFIAYLNSGNINKNELLEIQSFYKNKSDETSELVSNILEILKAKVVNFKSNITLNDVIDELPRIGGSHAQRDFINETFLAV
ncbi:MAG: hypothetical protein EAZ27_07290 [Cytophagales bacterium]|nr:MAG: hypothetical protein EAZ27_07290 [Cytophagales bacterium]